LFRFCMLVCFYKLCRIFKCILHVFKVDKNYQPNNTILNLTEVMSDLLF